MNPVIKKQTHYNVLFMRDDKEARTFRIHSVFLHFCLYFFLLVALGGGVSIFLGVKFFDRYRSTFDSKAALERENAELRLQLERLANLETLLSASNNSAPKTSYTEVGGGASPARSQNGGLVAVQPPSLPSPPSPPAQPTQPAAQSAPVAPVQNASAEPAVAAASEPQTDASKAAAGTGEETPPSVEKVTGYPSLSAPDSPLRIGDFSARGAGPQRLRISYDLSTATVDSQRTIAGSVRYVGVLADGTRLELGLTDTEGTRFSIVRMKPMQSTARLPQEIKVEDVANIEIFIEIAEGKTYRQTYAVRR